MKRITTLFTCMAMIAIFGAGCSGRVEEAGPKQEVTSTTLGKFTFAEKNPETGIIRGTYEFNGYPIKFEVVRGEPTPQEMKEVYPTAPSHSIDARLCDDQGYCFSGAAGGHAFANSNWVDEDPQNFPDEERSRKSNEAMTAMNKDLPLLDQKTFIGLEEEYQSLREVSTDPINPEIEYDPLHLKPQSSIEGTPAKGVLSLVTAAASTYTHYIQIWKEPLAGGLANHSATWSYIINNATGLRVANYLTGNHGATPLGENMTLYCTRPFADRSTNTLRVNTKCDVPATNGTMHPTGYTGCCTTQYCLKINTVGHVCNDDSKLQRDLMAVGTGPVNAPYCLDKVPAAYAPYCWD